MDLDRAIQSRKSVRKFNSKKPDWRDIIECIDVARYAPMAGNNYTLKFIMVDDPDIIQKLADAANQPFIAQAHYVVVVCTNPSRTVNAYGERGKRYCRQQAGAAIQNFLLKIQEKGLATCWVGAFVDNLVKRAVNIPEDINVEAIFPIGYEYSKTRPRLKIEIDRILYFNEYKNKKMKKPRKLDV
jgi:nitroreductase